MTEVFLKRLEDSLNSFEEEEVNLVLVANRVVTEYYNEDSDIKSIIIKINKIVEDDNIDDNIRLWVTLCSQVLMMRYYKTIDDMVSFKKIAKDIANTLEKLTN